MLEKSYREGKERGRGRGGGGGGGRYNHDQFIPIAFRSA